VALSAPTKPRVQVHPIAERDVPAVAAFLYANLNDRVEISSWAQALEVSWGERPNSGFMLRAGDGIVGVYLAFYSERVIDGRPERFCNLGAWCVLAQYRLHGPRLFKELLGQPGYHFTDLSPSGSVVGINTRMGFEFLDTTTTLVPNLPWPTSLSRATVSEDPILIAKTLQGAELEIYRDHLAAAAAKHVLLMHEGEWCYVIFRKDRRKGLALFASILHVSNPGLFRRLMRPLGSHLLLRHGAAVTLIERCVLEHQPRLSRTIASPRRKMFRSSTLQASQIDYLYSELVCVPW
jgi:hypothetical protein